MKDIKKIYYQIRKVKQLKETLVYASGIVTILLALALFIGIIQDIAINEKLYLLNEIYFPVGIGILVSLILIYAYVLFLTFKESELKEEADYLRGN